MNKINNILDFIISFNSKTTMKLVDFLNEKNISQYMTDQQEYFWNIKNTTEYKIPSFINQKQQELSKKIDSSKSLSIVAPTSFGKTFVIIQKIKKYPNTRIIISPTLSLCNEYFMELHRDIDKISMSPFVKASVYILTPEKFLAAKKTGIFNDTKISLTVFDEFYEAFAGYRFPIFEEAYQYLKIHSDKIIQIIPHSNVEMPKEFSTVDKFVTTATATNRKITKYVGQKTKELGYQYKKYVCSEFNKSKTDGFEIKNTIHDKEDIINKTLDVVKNQNKNIIILASKKEMYRRIEDLSSNLKENKDSTILQDIKKYLDETAQHTQLAKNILKGIAYHNGTMDKFLRLLIESAFKLGDIKILFGNSAITKGVNLSPDVLLVLKYPTNKRKFNEAINDIEILNAFGRTGRTKRNKQIGNVVILTTKTSPKTRDKDFLIKGEKEKIIIKKPKLDEVEVVNNFETAFKKYVVSKSAIKISVHNKELLLNYLKPSQFKVDDEKDIFDAIKSIYEISFHPSWEANRRFLINSYIMKKGYSNLIKSNRKTTKDWGFLSSQNFSPARHEGWTSKGKKYKNIKYQEGTFHEDLIAQYSYDQYEQVAGFYFAQLLSKAIEAMEIQHPDTAQYIKEYNNRKTDEENIASENGWPDSFGDYHLMHNKSDVSKDFLNDLIKKIYPKI